MAASEISVSVVIPVYDEQDTLKTLTEKIQESLNNSRHFEILFVDDGSRDNSWNVITELVRRYSFVKGLRLRRNFGKSAAVDAGIRRARGEFIVMMDADLQDEPQEIPRMLAKLEEGCDLVVGWKKERKDPLSKILPSKLFNRVTSTLTGVKLHDFNSGFKTFRRKLFESVYLYGELHRYLPAFAHSMGYRVAEIPVKHHPRRYGKSKFGVERYVRGMLDLFTVLTITRYSKRPGHLFGGVGVLLVAVGFLILLYMTGLWFLTNDPIGSRPLLLLGVLLTIVGLQFVLFGMLAEFLLHRSVLPKPREIVEEVLEHARQ